MKKILLAGAAALAFGLSSCDLGGSGENTSNTAFNTINLVTDLTTGQSVMSPGVYTLDFNYTSGTGTVSTTDLVFPSSGSSAAKHAFTTEPATFQQAVFNNGTYIMKVNSATGNVDKDSTLPLSKFTIRATTNVYTPSEEDDYINSIIGIGDIWRGQGAVITEYMVGTQYQVRTIPSVAFYKGTTTTTVSNTANPTPPYSTDEMLYGVFYYKNMEKADVVIYGAKFAAAAPSLTAVVLKGLDVTCSNGTFIISGRDVVPQVVEGAGLTPNARFPFTSFIMTGAGTWLQGASITYQVGDDYHGRCYGAYINEAVITTELQ